MAVAESAQPPDGARVGTLPVSPTLEEARALAGEHNLIPLAVSFVDDCETPVSAFLKLRALAPSEPAFLLESAEQGQRVGRWSFIGFSPHDVVRWSLADGGDPYELAAQRLARFRQAPMLDAPPFTGGAVGVFGYDLVRAVEPLSPPNPDPVGVPDLALMLTDGLLVFDHLKHTLTILVNVNLEVQPELEPAYAEAVAQIAEVREALAGPVPRQEPRPPREPPAFQSNMPREQFEAMVARIIEYIYAGDAFQVVPSQRWSAPSPVEAFSIYRGLRAVNPSPYMYFLDFGDFQVAGASPEPLLTVSGRRVSTKPIAGTRPRGATPEEDRRIAQELLADEKERAEHVMLVDLGRNDLGRVCEYGSVVVDELMEIESYSHVMHIVSSVSGTLRAEVGAMDALRSVLPAGTLSGAP
jgi:anthranilate synthase component 1